MGVVWEATDEGGRHVAMKILHPQIAADMRRASSQRMRQKAAKVTPRVTLIVTTALVPGALILLAAGMYIGFGDRFGGLLGG